MHPKIHELLKKKPVRVGLAVTALGAILFVGSKALNWKDDESTVQKSRRSLIESNVFDTGTLEKVDAEQAQATYDQQKKELMDIRRDTQKNEANQKRELDKVLAKMADMQKTMAEQSQLIGVLTRNNRIVNGNVSNARITRANESGLSGSNGVVSADGSPATLTPQQSQSVSRARGKPETNGMIRTVSSTSITNIKKTGVVEETPIVVQYVDGKQGTGSAGGAGKKQGPVDRKPTNPEIEKKKREMVKAKAKTYIPAGSIISGVMLNGVDAPTALSKNASPLPTTIRVKLDVLMPNSYNADLADCFVIGSVTGDLASERAYIRSVTMSCINERGESMETGMIGYAVSDFDGRNGIRGTVVSRAGKALITTFGASFLSAVAEATKPQAIPTLDQNPGEQTTFQTPDMTDVGKSGVLGGVSGGADRLAQYAISIAEQQWPVIEISPGTPVTFFLEKGMSLPVIE